MMILKKIYNAAEKSTKATTKLALKKMKITSLMLFIAVLLFRLLHGFFICITNDYGSFEINKMEYKSEYNDMIYVQAGFKNVRTPVDLKFTNGTLKIEDELTNCTIAKLFFGSGNVTKNGKIRFDGFMKVQNLNNNLGMEVFLDKEKHSKIKVKLKLNVKPRIFLVRFGFKKCFNHTLEFKKNQNADNPKISKFLVDDNKKDSIITLSFEISLQHMNLHKYLNIKIPNLEIKLKNPNLILCVNAFEIKNGTCSEPIKISLTDKKNAKDGLLYWTSQLYKTQNIDVMIEHRLNNQENNLIDMFLNDLNIRYNKNSNNNAHQPSYEISFKSQKKQELMFTFKCHKNRLINTKNLQLKLPDVKTKIKIDNVNVGSIYLSVGNIDNFEIDCLLKIEDINKVISFIVYRKTKCTILMEDDHFFKEYFGFNRVTFDMNGNVAINSDEIKVLAQQSNNNTTKTIKNIVHYLTLTNNEIAFISHCDFGVANESVPQLILDFTNMNLKLESSKIQVSLKFLKDSKIVIYKTKEAMINKLHGKINAETILKFKPNFFEQDFNKINEKFLVNTQQESVILDSKINNSRIVKILQAITDNSNIVLNKIHTIDMFKLLSEYELNVHKGESEKKKMLNTFNISFDTTTYNKIGIKVKGTKYENENRRFAFKNTIILTKKMDIRFKYISLYFNIIMKSSFLSFYFTEKGIETVEFDDKKNTLELQFDNKNKAIDLDSVIYLFKNFDKRLLDVDFGKNEFFFNVIGCISKLKTNKKDADKNKKIECLGKIKSYLNVHGTEHHHNFSISLTQSSEIIDKFNNFDEIMKIDLPKFALKVKSSNNCISYIEIDKNEIKYNMTNNTIMFNNVFVEIKLHKTHNSIGTYQILDNKNNQLLFILKANELKTVKTIKKSEKSELKYNIASIELKKNLQILGNGSWIDYAKNLSTTLKNIYKGIRLQYIPQKHDLIITVKNMNLANILYSKQHGLSIDLYEFKAKVNLCNDTPKIVFNYNLNIASLSSKDTLENEIISINPIFNLIRNNKSKEPFVNFAHSLLENNLIYYYIEPNFDIITESADKYYILLTDYNTFDFCTQIVNQQQLYANKHSFYGYINLRTTELPSNLLKKIVNQGLIAFFSDNCLLYKSFDILLIKNNDIIAKHKLKNLDRITYIADKIISYGISNYNNATCLIKYIQKIAVNAFVKKEDLNVVNSLRKLHFATLMQIVEQYKILTESVKSEVQNKNTVPELL